MLPETFNEDCATLFRPYTACIMEYTSLLQLVYDLENNKKVFKDWYVVLNGKHMSVEEFKEWFYHSQFYFRGAKFYEYEKV